MSIYIITFFSIFLTSLQYSFNVMPPDSVTRLTPQENIRFLSEPMIWLIYPLFENIPRKKHSAISYNF